MTWFLCALVVRLLVRLRVDGRARLPANGPVVIAGNHRSWIDPLAIVTALGPRQPVVFLAAREHIEKRRALDWLLGRLGTVIKVERGSRQQRQTLRACAAALACGASVALFPEGRINVSAAPLLPLEPGAAVIARRSSVPIVPVAIAGSRDLYLGRRITLVVGAPLAPGATHDDDMATTATLHDAILAILPPDPPPSRLQLARWLGRLE
jgi:1-acyl-sn-glycerol-3-phosphate acyltransferase